MNVRKARFSESGTLLEWLRGNKEHNDLDEKVLDYPTSELAVAENGSAKGVMPYHAVLMLESLGFAPDANPLEKLVAAEALLRHASSRAEACNMKEVVFLSSDAKTDELAVERFGFEKVVALRKKL